MLRCCVAGSIGSYNGMQFASLGTNSAGSPDRADSIECRDEINQQKARPAKWRDGLLCKRI
jgi:hypothetical protein